MQRHAGHKLTNRGPRSLDDHPTFKDWLFQRLETSDKASKQKIVAVL